MADACQRRGRLFHDEPNLAVYQALQTLSRIVHVCLTFSDCHTLV